MHLNIKLYDAMTIDNLPWPNTEEGRHAQSYLVPMVKNGPKYYIDNVNTALFAMTVGEHVLPVTVNSGYEENSYVCSPYAHFVEFGLVKMRSMVNPVVKASMTCILNMLGKLLKIGKVDKIVFVNNWLLSTDIHPPLNFREIQGIFTYLKNRFPHHVVAFRSVNPFKDPLWPAHFQRCGCRLIAGKKAFYFDAADPGLRKSRMFKSDLKILRESEYSVLEGEHISEEHVQRLADLYQSLYIDKHSPISPKLNHRFFEMVLKNRVFKVKALQRNGKIDALAGYFISHKMMYAPLFGYDTTLPQRLGLYRQISTVINLQALEDKVLLNQSSGAGDYKKLRCAKGSMDYFAVYSRHLPMGRRSIWKVLYTVMKYIGEPFMYRYDL